MSAMKDELERIVDSIEKHYRPEKIILFGSLAQNEATEGSDIDLLVIKDTDKDPWSRSEELDSFVQHGVPVDVLIYTPREIEERLAMNDFFVREILETGKVLYERGV